MTHPRGDWRQGFGRRLAYYLVGIALGLVILGLFQQAKRWAKAQSQPPTPQPAAQPGTADPTGPPPPTQPPPVK